MSGQAVGYIRVSSIDQSPELQLSEQVLDETFVDHCSGSTKKRPQLIACMKHLRKNDELHVHSIDRLARNLKDLQQIVEELNRKGVTVIFHKEKLTFSGSDDPFQKLQLQMLVAVSEFERAMIRERQREGILNTKKKGTPIGAPRKLSDSQIKEIRKMKANRFGVTEIAKKYDVSRVTVYKVLNTASAE